MNGARRNVSTAPSPSRSNGLAAAQVMHKRTASNDAALKSELSVIRREQKELRDAFFEAVQVHRKLCAPREARRGSFEIASEMFAVRHLSGDFSKVLDLESRTAVALGDVAGKGLSAGLWVAHLVGLIRIFTTEQASLPAAMASINRELCAALPEPPMVALFLARLDRHAGEVEYCNAGQPAALLLRSAGNGKVEPLQEGGPVLGAVREAAYNCGRVRLEPGDTLLAYSDGVVESRSAPGRGHSDEEFGLKRLTEAVRSAAGVRASEVLFSTLATVLDFAGGRPLEDDLTLMVIRRRESARKLVSS